MVLCAYALESSSSERSDLHARHEVTSACELNQRTHSAAALTPSLTSPSAIFTDRTQSPCVSTATTPRLGVRFYRWGRSAGKAAAGPIELSSVQSPSLARRVGTRWGRSARRASAGPRRWGRSAGRAAAGPVELSSLQSPSLARRVGTRWGRQAAGLRPKSNRSAFL
jgi:hypothetical protein